MKTQYSKPATKSVFLLNTLGVCQLASGGSGKSDPTPKPPAPGRRGAMQL